jgi:predicted Holliday junction resolvase-like endonuclease
MSELLEEYQQFRRILCVCPCCGGIHRVSDLRLKSKGRATRTWLDNFEEQVNKFDQKKAEFDEKEEELRATAREKGRKQAQKVIRKAICSSLKALKLDPFDFKPILHPVDFVVFKGMNEKESISDIMFLSREYGCPSLNAVRQQVKTAVQNKQYDWQVARIDKKGRISFES